MGSRRGQRNAGGSGDTSDLEALRENVLDHPDEEDEVSGNANENNASTGPIKVVVRQDGIGRTGGIVLGCVAGTALGIAMMTATLMILRDNSREIAAQQSENRLMEQLRKSETESRMVQYYLQDPSFRTKDELAEWARYKGIQDQQEKQQ